MKTKKAIIITTICLITAIAAAVIFVPQIGENAGIETVNAETVSSVTDNTETESTETENTETLTIETASADEVFYIENPAVKLENSPNYITDIGFNQSEYIGILGFSEYPLIIRKDSNVHAFTDTISNSDETVFVTDPYVDGERVLYYGKDGVVKKISEPDILYATLLSDGDELVWLSGDYESNHCTIKSLKDDKITTLTTSASDYGFWGSSYGNSLIWYEKYYPLDGRYTTYLYKDGITAPLGDEVEIERLSSDGEKIFYQYGSEFFVQSGFDSEHRFLIGDYKNNPGIAEYNDPDDLNTTYPKLKTSGNYTPDEGITILPQRDRTTARIAYMNGDSSKAIINLVVLGECATSIYYEEGKAPLFLADRELSIVYPEGGGIDDIRECYYTSENYDSESPGRRLDVFRYDGELKPVLDFSVEYFDTFAHTDDFLYENDEALWIYDSKAGEHRPLYEKTDYISYRFTSDLSAIYVWDFAQRDNGHPLYEVKPDGTKTRIAAHAQDFYVSDDTLYYRNIIGDLCTFKDGKSENVLALDEQSNEIHSTSFGYRGSGYYTMEVQAESSDYVYISTDGKNFVCIEDYVK